MWAEDQQLKTIRTSLKRARHRRRDPNCIKPAQLNDLAVQVDPAAARDHDIDFLGNLVTVRTTALPRLDDVIGKTSVLCA
jgi:hypothetical protein